MTGPVSGAEGRRLDDGLLGITDRECRICFALALWNGRDPILEERPFGLSNPEGNHGEDGTGLGASHQTGWSALAANVVERVAAVRAAGRGAP